MNSIRERNVYSDLDLDDATESPLPAYKFTVFFNFYYGFPYTFLTTINKIEWLEWKYDGKASSIALYSSNNIAFVLRKIVYTSAAIFHVVRSLLPFRLVPCWIHVSGMNDAHMQW